MKSRTLPDPRQTAKEEADRIKADREFALNAALDRVLVDAPWVARQDLLAGLVGYHREAMGRIPSPAKYPEAGPWVDYALAVDREVRRLAGLNDEEIALVKSLGPYLQFRGFRLAGLKSAPGCRDERCRAAFLPETDQGPLLMSNLDDPLTHWKPEPPWPANAPRAQFWREEADFALAGVGSGLHLDDEPEEIFPLPVLAMLDFHADDTPSAVDFLRRYAPFWGGSNLMVLDKQFRCLCIEKCSRNRFEVFGPDPDHGFSHVSGMVCRDPSSPQGRYQHAKRDEYLKLFDLPQDGPDSGYWALSREFERILVRGLRSLGRCPKIEDVFRLFHRPFPEGLNKTGERYHPDQGLVGYTLASYATLFDQRQHCRWQRSQDGRTWPDRPEICHYQ